MVKKDGALMRYLALALTMLVPGGAALAHPHIFIETGLEVIFNDQGQATAVRVTWQYDEFYSLVIIEDRGLDPDFDGVLSEGEAQSLSGFDMAWDADYDGDLYVLNQGTSVALGRPEATTASYTEGRITSTHLRQLAQPQQAGDDALLFQAYDTSYYTAYTIPNQPILTNAPTDCVAQVFEPDVAAADAALQEALNEYNGGDLDEISFPAVGAAYADEVRVICPES
jgi:ABC-type uncharacterized transport system substrate-binding protein